MHLQHLPFRASSLTSLLPRLVSAPGRRGLPAGCDQFVAPQDYLPTGFGGRTSSSSTILPMCRGVMISFFRLLGSLALALAVVLLAGCDEGPGSSSGDQQPPANTPIAAQDDPEQTQKPPGDDADDDAGGNTSGTTPETAPEIAGNNNPPAPQSPPPNSGGSSAAPPPSQPPSSQLQPDPGPHDIVSPHYQWTNSHSGCDQHHGHEIAPSDPPDRHQWHGPHCR